MEEEALLSDESKLVGDTYVDWRGRPCKSDNKHGGMRAATCILGFQAFEIMAVVAVANNLITYVFNEMYFPLSKAANIVTNFVGTIFLMSPLGGFLADSYLGSFWTILIFGFVEFSGFILLSIQAHLPQLRPPQCNMVSEAEKCLESRGFNAFILYTALFLVALGSGCVKPNMQSHGADQFEKKDPNHNKKISTFFNMAYFTFSTGELIALTALVWVQTHSGMDVGFGVSAAVMSMGLICLICGTLWYRNSPPGGNILTPIAQVFAAAIAKRKQTCPTGSLNRESNVLYTERFRFLDKACIKTQDEENTNESPWRLCTIEQVEQVKIILSVIPIFACTIIFNTILAQFQTFSVQQGSAMNTQLTKTFKIPPASLQAIPYMILIFVVPIYETVFVPFARSITKKDSGISSLQRVGVGLFLVTFSMISAALVESKRRKLSVEHNITLSIFWIVPQFLIFGISEMFTAVGFIEFFYKQSLGNMQSFLTAMSYFSYSFGFFLSSLLVSIVNKITSSSSKGGWLSYNNLNMDRLDLFYWLFLLALLGVINFLNYLFWSNWYSPPERRSQYHNLEQQHFFED